MRAMPVPVDAVFVVLGVLGSVAMGFTIHAFIGVWRYFRDYPPETPKQRDERRAIARAEAVERAAIMEMLLDNLDRTLPPLPSDDSECPPERPN